MYLWQPSGCGGGKAVASAGRDAGPVPVGAGAAVVVAAGGGEAPVALLAEPAQAGEGAHRAVEVALRGSGAEAGGWTAEDRAAASADPGVGAGECGSEAAQPGSVAVPVREA